MALCSLCDTPYSIECPTSSENSWPPPAPYCLAVASLTANPSLTQTLAICCTRVQPAYSSSTPRLTSHLRSRHVVRSKVSVDNRELLTGDCLILVAFCLFKQVCFRRWYQLAGRTDTVKDVSNDGSHI